MRFFPAHDSFSIGQEESDFSSRNDYVSGKFRFSQCDGDPGRVPSPGPPGKARFPTKLKAGVGISERGISEQSIHLWQRPSRGAHKKALEPFLVKRYAILGQIWRQLIAKERLDCWMSSKSPRLQRTPTSQVCQIPNEFQICGRH